MRAVDQTAEACFGRTSFLPRNRKSVAGEIRTSEFHARRETPERAPFPFSFEPEPLALRRVLNHHAIRSATASLCQNATRVVSVPTHGPGRRLSIATPVPRHESELNGTAAVRHIAPFAERVSTRTHDASAGGARQRRRQSETSVSRLALARFSRRDRPGPGSGARDEAPRTRSNAPTVRSSRPPPKFTR